MKKSICMLVSLFVMFSLWSCSKSKISTEADTSEINRLLTESDSLGVQSNVETVFGTSTTTKPAKKYSTLQSATTIHKSESSTYQLYKDYFFSNFEDDDLVYLADYTHDGQDDMVVYNITENLNGDVYFYTIINGSVIKIYEIASPSNRSTVFFTKKSGESNIVFDYHGIWQGVGAASCKEYYLNDYGEEVIVNEIRQEFGGNKEVRESYHATDYYQPYIDEQNAIANESFNTLVEKKYGRNYCKIYLFFSSFYTDLPCAVIDASSKSTFYQ